MTDQTASGILKIKNVRGLHARAAAAFVRVAEDFDAEITVGRDGQEVSGHSIMGLMMLGAARGSEIEVSCAGAQAKEALKALEKLVDDKFYED